MSLVIEQVTLSNIDKVMADIGFWFDPSMQCAPNLTNPYPPKGYVSKIVEADFPWPYAGFDTDLNMYIGLGIISPNIDFENNIISDAQWSWIVAQPTVFIDFTLGMVPSVLQRIQDRGLIWRGEKYLWAMVSRADIADLARANNNIREVSSEENFPPVTTFKTPDTPNAPFDTSYVFCLKVNTDGYTI